MRRRFMFLGLVSLWIAGPALAAPVTTDLRLSLALQLPGLDPIAITIPDVTVSVSGSSVTIFETVATGLGIVVPVTATTSFAQLSVNTLGVTGGIFSAGGLTAQLPGEVCSAGPGEACNAGGGIGGRMGMVGLLRLPVVPDATARLPLSAARVGQGGTFVSLFSADAAGWTTGAASVDSDAGLLTQSGTGHPFTLVTPTFLQVAHLTFPLLTTLTLTNVSVPEPGTLVLIGVGVVGLAVLRRDRP